jgi:hypothetical protein
MDIRNPIHTLLGFRRSHPRIHLRQRRRTERIVIAQQQRQTRDHNRDQQALLERRQFLLDVLCGFRDALIDCGDSLVSYTPSRTTHANRTCACHRGDDVVGVRDREGQRGERVAEAGAVDFVDFGYAEQHGGAVDEGCGEGAAIVGLYGCIELEDCVVDVDYVLYDGLAIGEERLGEREGGCEGEEGEEREEKLHGGG